MKQIVKATSAVLGACIFSFGGVASAYRDNPNTTLSAASIVFHVNDDDKDQDSTETVTVSCAAHLAGDIQSAGSGTAWHDQTTITAISLNNIDGGIEQKDCPKIHVTLDHATRGNDNFKFSFKVYLTFGSTRFTYTSGDLALTKDHGHYDGDLTKS
jgi:hypothetical protein